MICAVKGMFALGGQVVALATLASACAPSQREHPELMANCIYLHALWRRYENHTTRHTGQTARGEYVLHDCANNNYVTAIPELEQMLERGRLPPQLITAMAHQ